MTGPSPIPPANDDPIRREDLVAYLDGEMDAAAASRVEERLQHDDRLRDELHRLQRAWDMLGTLPRTEANPSLTRSTVEMLALEQEGDLVLRAGTHTRRRRLAWGAAAAILFVAGFLGALVAAAMWPDPERPLLHDLSVVQQLDPYQQAGSVEFLRALRQRGLFVHDEDERANTP